MLQTRAHTLVLVIMLALTLLPGMMYGIWMYDLVDRTFVWETAGPVMLGCMIGFPGAVIALVVWVILEARRQPVNEVRLMIGIFGSVFVVIVAWASAGNYIMEFVV